MGHSIQDYLKKINSRLSFSDTLSIAVTASFLVISALLLNRMWNAELEPIKYESTNEVGKAGELDERPFGSKNGNTYTYTWCQGSSRIKAENIVHYANAEVAEQAGRTLSKLCAKK